MTNGFTGKLLRVNLSSEKISFETLEETFYRKHFGGRGLISYILLNELEPKIDPLGPKNKLIFACGPVTGAPASGTGRNSVGAKSPLTGAYGEAEAGGYWGAELKRAGIDAIIIEGKASNPVYLWINDQHVELKDASKLWGHEIRESQQIIRKELDNKTVKVAQIGPGGEKQVRYACVINDMNHAAGRCGMGAVMGSKNLKAVAVKGSKSVPVRKPKRLRKLAQWMATNVDSVARVLHVYGTGVGMDAMVEAGNLPIRNFRDGDFPEADNISAETVKNTVSVGMGTCFACAIACKKEVKVTEPWTVDPEYGGPEYETLASLGSNCGVGDLKAVCKANELCQRYSIDTISTGTTISFAMECFEHGLLTTKDTEGIELTFGNAEAMLKVIEQIGEKRGIGKLLAQGTKRAAEQIGNGAEQFAVHVKGEEVPMHDPRLKRGEALGYAVSPTGADHVHNIHDTFLYPELPNQYKSLGVLEAVPVEDFGPKKVRLYKYVGEWRTLNNFLVMCLFTPWSVTQKVDIVRSVTGWNTTAFELMKVVQRGNTLARIFNLREGFTEKDDWLPPRFFKPRTSGNLKNAVDADALQNAKLTYYDMMGWTNQGVPKQSALDELDIGWASRKIVAQ
ncbi:MAG: aldehyde ferredoxin oxidoreductase family protein [Candidatus Bathyarchaeota archaeon]|nr:aldehyde ferredoxin oxidoreductase family protein [Candidatus Bathyarchaeota archaeon]